MMITFPNDVAKRKRLQTPESFRHPAKMHVGMLLWCIGKFTKPGDIVLDPMAGSGSTLLATRYGRNVVTVELEPKFVDIQKGFNCDGLIPGYKNVWIDPVECGWLVYCGAEAIEHLFDTRAEAEQFYNTWDWKGTPNDCGIQWRDPVEGFYEKQPIPTHCGLKENHEPHYISGNWDKIQEIGAQPGHTLGSALILQGDARNLTGLLADNIITSPPYSDSPSGGGLNTKPPREGRADQSGRSSTSPSQVGAGRYDQIITNPPYEATFNEKQHTLSGIAKRDASMRTEVGGYSGRVGVVISSPPYEGSLQGDVNDKISEGFKSPAAIKMLEGLPKGYSKEVENIGNLRKESYLQAMSQVYQQCYNILKHGGLMILVTKDFIRKKQRVLLSMDTIKLCELAGFELFEWHQRKLTQQSFWRTLYHNKHPEVEQIDTEDILVFKKNNGQGIVDKVITSPPFKEQMQDTKWMQENQPRKNRGKYNPKEQDEGNIGNLAYRGVV